jgi:hypothetical protein
MNHWASARRRVDVSLLSEGLGQHVLVEREIRCDLLQTRIFFPRASASAAARSRRVRKLLFPEIERRFAHAELSAGIGHGRAAFRLAQCARHLLHTEFGLLHNAISLPR